MDTTLQNLIKKTVDDHQSDLQHLSTSLWRNPEIKFEEEFAHSLLTDFLEEKGFRVSRNYVLPTAFRAEYTRNVVGRVPTVALICEYDALPGLGHACAHNLISEASIGAALAVKAALDALDKIDAKLVVLGCPAEELSGGGKIHLINAGAFNDIHAAMMIHPQPTDLLEIPLIACHSATVRYSGVSVHAAMWPWDGVNALDAVVHCYNSLSMLRQQLKPTWRLHSIITQGGDKLTNIPDHAEMKIMIRTPNRFERLKLKDLVTDCAEGAAKCTRCKVLIEWDKPYEAMCHNRTMLNVYRQHAENMGILFEDDYLLHIMKQIIASTDMGNVSLVVPSIHVGMGIGPYATFYRYGTTDQQLLGYDYLHCPPAPIQKPSQPAKSSFDEFCNGHLEELADQLLQQHRKQVPYLQHHTPDFARAAISVSSQRPTLVAAKSLALTAMEVLISSELRQKIRNEFEVSLLENGSSIKDEEGEK